MNNRNLISPVVILFILVNAFLIVMKSRLQAWGFDIDVLLVGNTFLFLLSIFTYFLHRKAIKAARTPEFLKYFYLAFLLKFFLTIALVVVYALIANSINKPAILSCMGLYLVYTFIETRLLLKASKRKNA